MFTSIKPFEEKNTKGIRNGVRIRARKPIDYFFLSPCIDINHPWCFQGSRSSRERTEVLEHSPWAHVRGSMEAKPRVPLQEPGTSYFRAPCLSFLICKWDDNSGTCLIDSWGLHELKDVKHSKQWQTPGDQDVFATVNKNRGSHSDSHLLGSLPPVA